MPATAQYRIEPSGQSGAVTVQAGQRKTAEERAVAAATADLRQACADLLRRIRY